MALNENQKEVIKAYIWIRKHNQTIPDNILNTMKEEAIAAFGSNAPRSNENPNVADIIGQKLEGYVYAPKEDETDEMLLVFEKHTVSFPYSRSKWQTR